MKKILLYTSGQISKTRITGGVRRFLELLRLLPNFCQLYVMAGDSKLDSDHNIHFISMNHGSKQYANEIKRGLHNLPYLIKEKKNGYDSVIVFDVPPAVILSIVRMPHICLMVRKDMIGYKKQYLEENKKRGIIHRVEIELLSLAEGVVLSRAEKIIVQCEYDKQRLIARHPLLIDIIEDKTHIQINNINPSWSSIEKTEHKVAHDRFAIGCITNFSSLRKGCDIFLESAKKMIENGYPIKAYIAGDGTLLDFYKRKYSKYEDIEFLGHIQMASDVYSKCDLAVIPSREDSCPNTLLESIMCETPAIGSNRGGIPEILNNKEALFEADEKSLYEKVLELYLERSKLTDLQNKQQKRKAELTFDWVQKIFNIIDSGDDRDEH